MSERLTPEERLQKLKKQQEAIKRKIKAEQSKISKEERKKRTRHLIEIGGLVAKAKVDQVDKAVLLGAFVEISEKLNNPAQVEAWKIKGDAAFKTE